MICRINKVLGAFLIVLCITGVSAAATVTGIVKYDGDVPQFNEIKMDADPICLAKHTSAVFPETLVLGANKELANVLVVVKSGYAKKDYPVPTEPAVLDQEGCHYKPHVFVLRVGQPLKILNNDGTLHNVHILSKVNAEVNMAMPQFRKEALKTFDKEETEPFAFKCDVHPWMTAWSVVLTHPFYAVSGTDGKFSIANLEPGTYEIEAWHEKLGVQKATVTVAGDETKTTDFTFSRPK